jgi:hypothetical protein
MRNMSNEPDSQTQGRALCGTSPAALCWASQNGGYECLQVPLHEATESFDIGKDRACRRVLVLFQEPQCFLFTRTGNKHPAKTVPRRIKHPKQRSVVSKDVPLHPRMHRVPRLLLAQRLSSQAGYVGDHHPPPLALDEPFP